MEGFFSLSKYMQQPPISSQPKCGSCKLLHGCATPKMPPSGIGRRKVLIVGEAPGAEEDEQGVQFVGKTGKRLRPVLKKIGIVPNSDCWFTNALICFTGDTVVQSPSKIEKVHQRTYTGPLVRIKTLGGRSLTGTPNHPILTDVGWVSLGLLKKGDNLVCCSTSQRLSGSGAYINNPPTTFKEIFDSSLILGHVERVVGSCMDFHGDGEDGNVDVVCTDSFLGNMVESSANEHLSQEAFVSPDECQVLLVGACSGTSNLQPLFDGSFSSSNSFVSSSCDSSPATGTHFVHPDSHGTTTSSYGNFQSLEESTQTGVATAERVRQRLQALPGEVTLDSVIDIETTTSDQIFSTDNATDRTSHDSNAPSTKVYNLQTEHGYYIVGGIVVSNCRPPGNVIKNEKMIDYCRPNLLNTIKELQPEVIILLGGRAVASLILHLWKDDKKAKGGMRKWAGWQIPNQQLNTWLCPTYHPSFIERMENEELEKLWEGHIKAAFQLQGRPWKKVPPFSNKVTTIYNEEEAYHAILGFIGDKPVAFDYETNMLKPDSDEAMIACCSLSDGKYTIAFPWFNKAQEAMKYFLKSDTPKIASNMKFEERWTLKMFGHGVKNWKIDTMLAAHTLDNRPGITSIKFQAFVKLGVDAWGTNMAKFLGGRIAEADMEELLTYCGLDSLYEYKVAFQQWKEIHK